MSITKRPWSVVVAVATILKTTGVIAEMMTIDSSTLIIKEVHGDRFNRQQAILPVIKMG